jgi:hypothetical protein
MTLFFRNATPMLELLLMRAAGASSCSNNQVADNAYIEPVHSQQSNDTSVNKKDISVSIEKPINLCYINKSMQILGERGVKGLKTEEVTIRKSLPTETQGALCGAFEDKEVEERMQRFRSPKCAIKYVLEGIDRFSENINKKLENQILRDKKRKALGNLFSYEGYSFQTHAASILSDFVYILKRFADSDKDIKELCDIFYEFIEGKNSYIGYKDGKFYVKRLKDYDKNIKEESVGNDEGLKQISDLLKEALRKYDLKAVARDNIQTSDNKLLEFALDCLEPISVAGRDASADEVRRVVDTIKQRNEKNGTEFFYLKSFDEVIQYISDYVESILVAERGPTKDEFRYIFGIIDKLKNDDRIKFFKEKSSLFRHFSEYVAKSDKSSEEYANSESTIQGRHAMCCAARFVDEMIICCQKDFYFSFLTRFLLFPRRYLVDHFDNPFGEPIWSDGIWDFRLNKFKRPLECHTAVIGRILKDKDAVFVDL